MMNSISRSQPNLRGLTALAAAWICLMVAPAYALDNGGAPTAIEGLLFGVSGPSPAAHFKDPLGITFSPNTDEFLVADTGNREVLIFAGDGSLAYRFTHFVNTNGQLVPGSPRCALQGTDGRIYITDVESPFITVANPRGEPIERIDPAALLARPGARIHPCYLAWGPNGSLYVAIAGDQAGVMELDADHQLIRSFNGPSREEGELSSPTGISVDAAGRVLVTDPGAFFSVNIFSAEGAFVSGFGRHDTGWENFSFASGVVEAGGMLWVADAVRQVVKGLSREGNPLYLLGGEGVGPGDLLYPISVASDGHGRLFVLERAGARVQAFEVPAERVAAGP